MEKRATRRATALICAVIIAGFALTSCISYNSNREAFEKDAERTSLLAAQGVARDIDAQFTRPIDVSLAMAHDTLLAAMLAIEPQEEEDGAYVEQLRSYLDSYRDAFPFDSVFLVSTTTGRYYHFNGVDRTMAPDNPENAWYYAFLDRDEEYSINIDNDEATEDEITVFVNARVLDDAGATRAVVGVGFRMDGLQALLAGFEADTQTRVRLIDCDGAARITTDPAEEGADPFGRGSKASEGIRASLDAAQSFWYDENGAKGFLVSQHLPSLGWFLVVDHDTSQLDARTARQFATAVAVIALVVAVVVAATTSIFHRCNRLAASQATASEQKRKSIFQEAAEQFYDNIYEIDVTHNRAASEETERYFESLGAPASVPYDDAIAIIAEKQIAADYRQGYLDTFHSAAVLAAHEGGKENLTYEFLMTDDGVTHHWVRIYAHLFLWEEDESVRMLVYRQNIDSEKAREQRLFEQMQRDSLTGLLNKAAAQQRIEKPLDDAPDKTFAFFIMDIDDFKKVNDHWGHSAGDAVLARFGKALQALFRAYDVVGRIGGDEFVAFVPAQDAQAARDKAARLVEALRMTVQTDAGPCTISVTVGVALDKGAHAGFEDIYRHADQALYRAKVAGKDRFEVYGS